jgi:low affinity Fe/Cu permease
MVAFAAALVAALMVGVLAAAECLAVLPLKRKTQNAKLKTATAIALFVVTMGGGGCRSFEYTDASGRRFNYSNFAFDSKIGKLTITTPNEVITIENLDSQSQALQVAREALQAVRP